MSSPVHPSERLAELATTLAGVLACIFFFLAGRAFLPHLGLQNDEALFATGIYDPSGVIYSRSVFHHSVPLMLMSYLGALKTWIYMAVFHFWAPDPASIRTPMLLAGTLTVWLSYLFLRHFAGRRAAVLGAWLLATDAQFLLTTTMDWGPVALQHLLLVAGLLGILCFAIRQGDGRADICLGAGFLMFGMALWDKALFLWNLTGMGVGALTAYKSEMVRNFTLRRAGIISAAFCLGALPLILYNGSRHFETLRANASYDISELGWKFEILRRNFDGSGLFGWMIREDSEVARPLAPHTRLERVSTGISTAARHPRKTLMPWAFLASLGCLPMLWRSSAAADRRVARFMLFCLIFLTVAWVEMGITRGAGGSIHHTILLWPIPVFFVAVALAAATRKLGRYGRPVLAGVLLLLVSSNVLVLNEYYARLTRNGGGANWTEAIYTLAGVMRRTPASRVFVTDWGILDSLRLLDQGTLPLAVSSDPLSKPALDAADREVVRGWLADPSGVFVGHVDGAEFFPGVNAHLRETAEALGYRRETICRISDRRGRPVYEVFRFRPGL